MDEFTKNDIGKKVYFVNPKYIDADGAAYINLCTIDNVSVSGKYAKVSFNKDSNPEEFETALLAKSYTGLKSVFENLLAKDECPRKLMAYRRALDGRCVCIMDYQVTDIYGDTTLRRAAHSNGRKPIWPYGTDKNKGLMTVDEVCMFINEHFDYPFGTIYTMDKATDDWWMCPHCGSSDTDIDGEYGGGDERFIEHYRCRKCNCLWENIYDRAPRIERKLIK